MAVHKLDTQMYVGQKAFINRGGQVLILRDPDHAVGGQVGLDFPGGKYRWGKNLADELQREVFEETSVKIRIGAPFITWTNHDYKSRTGRTNIFVVGYLCEYVSGNVRLSEEHDKFEWVDVKNYIKWKEDSPYFRALEEYFKLK